MSKLLLFSVAMAALPAGVWGGASQLVWDDHSASHYSESSILSNSNDTISPPIEGMSIAYGIDTSVSPCDDFYAYANGGWRKSVVFPAGWEPRRRTWSQLQESGRKTLARMKHVIDSAHGVRKTTNNSALRAVGIFYESCLSADSLEVILSRRVRKDSTQKDSTRAEQCVQRVFQYLGPASGQVFTEDFVGNKSVQRMKTLLASIKAAVHNQIGNNSLMNAEEILDMQKRLDKLYLRVGIPDTKVDYSSLALSPIDYNRNKDAIANFNTAKFVSKIGSDEREQWKNSLFTANAFYNLREHSIEVPPAMFLPPFFDVATDDAQNFASVGYVIAHEIFHGLAMQLAQSANPMVKIEIDSFQARNSTLGTVDGWPAGGKRTYVEDIADLGGIRTAYAAWEHTIARDKKAETPSIDGFTPAQRFFLSFGRVWRAKWASSAVPGNDTHSAYFARVNGMVMQMPEFAQAFGCKAGDRMVLSDERRSKLW